MIKEDNKIVEKLGEIRDFLDRDYRVAIDDVKERFTPVKANVDKEIVFCPKCAHLICMTDEIEEWTEYYDISETKTIYCTMCGNAIDISEVLKKIKESEER